LRASNSKLASSFISSSEQEISENIANSKAAPRKSSAQLDSAVDSEASRLKGLQHDEAENIIRSSEAVQANHIAYIRHAKDSKPLAIKLHASNAAEASLIIPDSESKTVQSILAPKRPAGSGKALAAKFGADNKALADAIVRSYHELTGNKISLTKKNATTAEQLHAARSAEAANIVQRPLAAHRTHKLKTGLTAVTDTGAKEIASTDSEALNIISTAVEGSERAEASVESAAKAGSSSPSDAASTLTAQALAAAAAAQAQTQAAAQAQVEAAKAQVAAAQAQVQAALEEQAKSQLQAAQTAKAQAQAQAQAPSSSAGASTQAAAVGSGSAAAGTVDAHSIAWANDGQSLDHWMDQKLNPARDPDSPGAATNETTVQGRDWRTDEDGPEGAGAGQWRGRGDETDRNAWARLNPARDLDAPAAGDVDYPGENAVDAGDEAAGAPADGALGGGAVWVCSPSPLPFLPPSPFPPLFPPTLPPSSPLPLLRPHHNTHAAAVPTGSGRAHRHLSEMKPGTSKSR
jgi:hypothetical protein